MRRHVEIDFEESTAGRITNIGANMGDLDGGHGLVESHPGEFPQQKILCKMGIREVAGE